MASKIASERRKNFQPVTSPELESSPDDANAAGFSIAESASPARDRIVEAALRQTTDIVYVFSSDYDVIFANRGAGIAAGVPSARLLGKKLKQLGLPKVLERSLMVAIKDSMEQSRLVTSEVPFEADGEKRVYSCHCAPVSRGAQDYVIVNLRNLTEPQKRLREAEARANLQAAIIGLTGHVMTVQAPPMGSMIEVHGPIRQLLNITADQVQGKPALMLFRNMDQGREFYRKLEREGRVSNEWITLRGSDGCDVNVYASAMLFDYNGENVAIVKYDEHPAKFDSVASKLVEISQDLAVSRAEARDLKWQADYDILTSLPNRRLFFQRLDHIFDIYSDRDCCRISVIYIDLDNFKVINDTHGHDVGDLLLQAFARRLKDTIGKGDTPARLGGDEFAVLMEEENGSQSLALNFANELRQRLAKPVETKAGPLKIEASIGIYSADVNGLPREFVAKADAAMYEAKRGSESGIFQVTG